MFGKPQQNNFGKANPANNGQGANRPAITDVAQIQGGGLVQIIITSFSPLTYYMFLNDQAVSQMDVESLNIAIELPADSDPSGGMIRATFARYVDSITGGKTVQRTELFPCTIELVALKRRISIICANPNSFEGLIVSAGLQVDGTSRDLFDINSLNILLTEGLFDAKVTWSDGQTESVFPQM